MIAHFVVFSAVKAVKDSSRQETGMDWKVNVENNLTTIGLAPANPNTYCLLLLSKCSALFKRAAMDEVKRHRHYQHRR